MLNTYCYECDKNVSFNVNEIEMKIKVKNVDVFFMGKIAYCDECGEEVYIASIRNENVHNANYAYRKAEGIVTVEEIQELLDKYSIGKKPIAELLGWGEMTIIRYLQGLMPSKEYSERLKELFNPHKMKELYDRNKLVLTPVAQRKLEDNITNYLNLDAGNHEIDYLNVANYFLSKIDVSSGECITPLKIQKLVYYAQAWMLAIHSKVFFEQNFQAWLHGPVLPELYFYFKNNGYESSVALPKVSNFSEELFDSEQETVLEIVWKVYGKFDGKHLEKITHKEEPWIASWEKRESNTKGNVIIEKETIRNFYFNLKQKLGFNLQDTTSLNQYVSLI